MIDLSRFPLIEKYRQQLGVPPLRLKAGALLFGASNFHAFREATDGNSKIEAKFASSIDRLNALFEEIIEHPVYLVNLCNTPASAVETLELISENFDNFSNSGLQQVFVFYIGHGIDLGGRLHLAVSSTKSSFVGATSISFDDLIRLADRKLGAIPLTYIVVDSCYSGLAVGRALQTGQVSRSFSLDAVPGSSAGLALAFSCGSEEALRAPSNYEGLPMSDLLVEALTRGVARAPPFMSFVDLIDFARREIQERPWLNDGRENNMAKRYPAIMNMRVAIGDPASEKLFLNETNGDLLPRIERELAQFEAGVASGARWIATIFDANPLTSSGGDLKVALFWFRQAAELGDSYSQYKLGWYYLSGWPGISKDSKSALRWYLLGAKNGSVEACVDLYLYFRSEYENQKLTLPPTVQSSMDWYVAEIKRYENKPPREEA